MSPQRRWYQHRRPSVRPSGQRTGCVRLALQTLAYSRFSDCGRETLAVEDDSLVCYGMRRTMAATLERLVRVQSALGEEVADYLAALRKEMAKLPRYFPESLEACFDELRQRVQVLENPAEAQRRLAQEHDQAQDPAAAQSALNGRYVPPRARSQAEASPTDSKAGVEPQPKPQPIFWDEKAFCEFPRAVILGDPGYGKTWLLRAEARRLAGLAWDGLQNRSLDLNQLTVPVFVHLSVVNAPSRHLEPLEETLADNASLGRTAAFKRWLLAKLATRECVVLLDAWDEVPVEQPASGQQVSYASGRQCVGRRLTNFARKYSQPRILLTSRIVGYNVAQPPIPDAKELELLAFDVGRIEAFTGVWFRGAEDAGRKFLTAVRQSSQLVGLARIPLMLTLLCRLCRERREETRDLPDNRGEIYRDCLDKLLGEWSEEKGRETIGSWRMQCLRVLQSVSLELLSEGCEQFTAQRIGKRVALVWAIEGQPANAGRGVVYKDEGFVGHAGSLCAITSGGF